jgi:hypothetical protein
MHASEHRNDTVIQLDLDEVLTVEGSPLVAELQPQPKLEYFPDAITWDYEKVVFFALDLKEWLSVHFRNSGYNPETGWMYEYIFDWVERFEVTDETINWMFGNRRAKVLDYVRWTGTVYLRVEDDLVTPEDVLARWAKKIRAAKASGGLDLTYEELELTEIEEPDDDVDALVRSW